MSLLALAFFTGVLRPSPTSAAEEWGRYRGATISATVSESDIAAFAATGGNLLRITFGRMPLMKKEPPYDFDESAFVKLDQLIDWCERYGVKAVIDPHTTPGTLRHTTTLPRDRFWQEYRWHELLIRLWSEISRRQKHRGSVIAAYDLLNEPAAPLGFPQNGPGSWNELVPKLISAIRQNDPGRWLIVEPVVGRSALLGRWIDRLEGMSYLAPPPAPRLVYSPHMYIPREFTHQGVVKGLPLGVKYPGKIAGEYWDKLRLKQALQHVLEYQRRYGVPIYIGEFSAARASGASGLHYLRDLIEIFEENGWSWTYHAWRQALMWDAELTGTDESDSVRSPDAPRLLLLKEAFARNRVP